MMNSLMRILRYNQIGGTVYKSFKLFHSQKVCSLNVLPTVHLNNVNNPWIWQKNDSIKLPIPHTNQNTRVIKLPNGLQWVPPLIEPVVDNVVEAPSGSANISKEAARLIIIRRKKMKKHKLKKLRKRMKFEWAKVRQKRELRKEKLFQANLIHQCKEGEAFSAEEYVQEKLNKLKELNEVIIPKQVNKGKQLH